MSLPFAVVYEADSDFNIATQLADRVLLESIAWLDSDQIEFQRNWMPSVEGSIQTSWKNIKRLACEAGIRAHGHFDGDAGLPDATAARKAIEYLLFKLPNLQAILLIRDQDDQPSRRGGLEQARKANRHPVHIVIGLASVERECWVLTGFEPENENERQLLENERKALGFNPCARSQELTACKDDNATRSAKRVLKTLIGNNWERQQRCWQVTSLELLRERGSENGLTDYLREVEQRLVPLLSSAH